MAIDAEETPILGDNRSEWPEVTIIVLNWNNYEDTAQCLESLEKVKYPNFEVIVVDNGSIDKSGNRLESEFPECEFIFNNQNLGFAAGCNPGIDFAIEDGADYVLLLNNDTIVNPDFLEPLVQTAEENPDAAAIGGVIYDAESGEVWSAGGQFYPTLAKMEQNTTPRNNVYETGFIPGALLLLPRDFVQDLGGLNESYFFGMEDEELAWEARRRGLRLLINPRSKVYHYKGSSATSPFRYYHATRNRLQFASNNLSVTRALGFYCFFMISRLLRFVQWGINQKSHLTHATIAGIIDHLRDTPPRMVSDFES